MTHLLAAPPAPLLLAPPRYTDNVYCADALAFLRCLPDASVDMVLADLPYAVTQAHWDKLIPLEPMWAAFKRVIKPKGVIALTAVQPFTSMLVMSNLANFQFCDVWDKKLPTGHLNARRMPLRRHEDVLIFSPTTLGNFTYNPQMRLGQYRQKGTSGKQSAIYGRYNILRVWNDEYYPTSVIEIANANQTAKLHETEKPVDLFAYLIRTYTRPGDLVCDPTCGSGTTAVAARQTGRHYIVNDYDPHWYDVTCQRLAQPFTLPLPFDTPAPAPVMAQAALF